MLRFVFLVVLLLIFVQGCTTPPVKINRFTPQAESPPYKTLIINNDTYANYDGVKYKVSAALFECQSIMVMFLEIFNNTDKSVNPEDYSVSLSDGRDFKKIRMLSRQDLVTFKAEYEGLKASGNLIDNKVVQDLLNEVLNKLNVSSRSYILKSLEVAINDYFAFRPVYAHEKRKGILCFFADFKPEYPITLNVNIKGEKIKFKLVPQSS